ncbi:Protein kinase domain-containing protein [Actinokineospora alba]|uniref:non-specific serine/threonine protein kinase n=1 Tax=Actinokineospora alba TaxID=504798 RepID=A0A1H0T2Y4_9PSEU|nr:serine/threonine-protein kinase [Actinokineospora alba]TDP66404.1 protein kinase-like protein [Actinokineospora alba]SDJ24295.1 Protein kinase domain-containing protein [Actinokineospora alba]SDP48151.1 Protein kinase domain-containing protein [Actinokineospora alba]
MAEPRLVAGRYALLGELGRGGMGVVWLAEDRVIGRRVALKELPFPPGHDPAVFQERVLREARTAGGLNDPAIVTVYDVSFERGFAYLVMELVQAPTLADLIAAGPLAEARVVTIARQVLGALKSAHDAGIVHRDVKPSNIMVLPGDRVKLADFGIARGVDDPSLTATGGIMGSPGYMAPELFAGSQPGPAADLWSLGATLFHAVEGKAPFTRTTTAATMHAILTERPQPSRCGEPLSSLLNGLLSQDPAQRLNGTRAAALLGAPADAETTVTFPPVAVADGSTELVAPVADSTELVAGPTMAVVSPQRSTRENVMDAAAPAAPAWVSDDPWDEKKSPSRKVPALLAGAAAVVVATLVAVFVLVPGDEETPTAMPVVDKQTQSSTPPATLTETPTSSSGAPSSTAPPSSSTSGAPSSGAAASGSVKPTTASAGQPVPPKPTTAVTTTKPPPTWTRTVVTRYNHPTGWHVLTTPASPAPAGFSREHPLGALSANPAPGTKKMYSCKQNTSEDHFTSVDQSGGCEGHRLIGLLGYVFTAPPEGARSASIYRCTYSGGHFDSVHADCEGYNQEYRMGYLLI